MWQLRMHCILSPPDLEPVILRGFWPILYCACTHTHCYFAAPDQNSDITIRFSDTDFLKDSNNLATRRRFHVVTLTFDT